MFKNCLIIPNGKAGGKVDQISSPLQFESFIDKILKEA